MVQIHEGAKGKKKGGERIRSSFNQTFLKSLLSVFDQKKILFAISIALAMFASGIAPCIAVDNPSTNNASNQFGDIFTSENITANNMPFTYHRMPTDMPFPFDSSHGYVGRDSEFMFEENLSKIKRYSNQSFKKALMENVSKQTLGMFDQNASRFTVSLSSNTYYVPDNYAKIQWAVDNASDGDTIIVRDGTYIENVDVDKRLTIRSENGPGTTIVQAANSNDNVFEVWRDYVNISGFTVKGASWLGYAGIDIRPFCSSNVCIVGNIISSNDLGIKIWSTSNNNNIRDNIISSNEDSGIWVMGSSHIITGNTISDNGDYGIDIWDSSSSIVSENTISNNRDGIILHFASIGNTISGNSISSNSGSGIKISGAGASIPSGNTLSSNTVSNNNRSGILFTAGTDNTVTNNIVSNNNDGIKVGYSTNNQITNNAVLNSRGYGIHVYGLEKSHFDNFIDTTNTVNGKPVYYYFDESSKVIEGLDTTHLTLAYCSNFRVINSGINNGDGVYLPHSNNNSFDGNDISSNNVDGIYLYYSDDNSISDNIISSNSDHGIHLWGSDTNEITDNTVSNNDDGIWLWDYSDNNIITGNSIFSNNRMGIYLRLSRDNIIDNNNISLNNDYGIYLFMHSASNLIYHNNFIDNTRNAGDYSDKINFWDNGSEGNYWSDYTGSDSDGDGIGDTPYIIPGSTGSKDNYPLMKPFLAKPDLVITHKWVCWPDNCTICYNVTNIGEGTAPACHSTTLYIDGVEVAHDHVLVDLTPGESYTGCFDDYTWAYTPPSDNITVCADNNETLDEFDESNNCVTNIWMCGDVAPPYGTITWTGDVMTLAYYNLGAPGYTIKSEWAGDVAPPYGTITWTGDVMTLAYYNLGAPGYEIHCCCEA